MGYICPPPLPDPRRDWAVVRLKKPVVGVVPFAVDPLFQLHEGQNLTTISAQSFDFWKEKKGKKHFPKAIGTCTLKKIHYLKSDASYFSSNCDTGLGASGGAFLSDVGPSPVLLGLIKGNNEKDPEVDAVIKRGFPNVRPYQASVWASYGVALRGEFLRAVLKAAYGDEKAN
jgi:hypothetical protein